MSSRVSWVCGLYTWKIWSIFFCQCRFCTRHWDHPVKVWRRCGKCFGDRCTASELKQWERSCLCLKRKTPMTKWRSHWRLLTLQRSYFCMLTHTFCSRAGWPPAVSNHWISLHARLTTEAAWCCNSVKVGPDHTFTMVLTGWGFVI